MRDNDDWTTIMVRHDTRNRLKERKILKPDGWGIETFDDVIRREMKFPPYKEPEASESSEVTTQ